MNSNASIAKHLTIVHASMCFVLDCDGQITLGAWTILAGQMLCLHRRCTQRGKFWPPAGLS